MKPFLVLILFFTTLLGKASTPPKRRVDRHRRCISACRLLWRNLIKTPNIDRMARDGIRCKNAFVTSPVCSSSRSAMVSRHVPALLGPQPPQPTSSGKGGGNAAYYESYEVPKSVKLIPELFRDAGYFVTNKSKTDYNFIPTSKLYHGNDWKKGACRPTHLRPIPTQWRKEPQSEKPCRSAKVVLPPYYPDARPSPGLGQVFGLLGKNR